MVRREEQLSLTEQAVRLLRDDIVSAKFSPGQRLNIETLKRRYEMGGTPVREALNQLIGESWVEAEPLKGFRVAPVSLLGWGGLMQVRQSMELGLVCSAMGSADDTWEANCVGAYYRLLKYEQKIDRDGEDVLAGWCERYLQFMQTLCHVSHQPWLARVYRNFVQHRLRYTYAVYAQTHNLSMAVLDWARDYEVVMDELPDRRSELVLSQWQDIIEQANVKVNQDWVGYW